MSKERIGTEEVARRLGVKRETVYAYVSRGQLRRDPASTPHRSLFDRGEVERLAGRARRTDRSGALEVVVETQLTKLDPDGALRYRGHDALELARFRSFEEVAALLWDGPAPAPWEVPDELRGAVDGAAVDRGAIDSRELPLVLVAALAAADPERDSREPAVVRRIGTTIVAALIDDPQAGSAGADRSIAARLWAALDPSGEQPGATGPAALNAALVLLADHELSTSAFAARIAASTWAGPYRAVLAGLATLGGPLHGAAGGGVEDLLASLRDRADVAKAVDHHLVLELTPPGLGGGMYRDRDPRADLLLGYLPRAGRDRRLIDLIEEFLRAAEASGMPAPNVDFALAALARAMGLRAGAAQQIFIVARTVGLIAHALEEYPHRLRFRPRARYVGETSA